MIKITNLDKSFGKVEVLKDLSLEVKLKGISSILGPNGSGKTTLIKSLLGMVIPDSGEMFIDGEKINKKWVYRKDISYLPQIANFPINLTVVELLKMIKDIRGEKATDEELIEIFDLKDHLKQKLGNLSGGTKQKVNLVLTFMFDSPLIILDEPTSGLDPISLIHLKEVIRKEKEKGKTILITSHIMSFVEEITDEVIFLLDGSIHYQGAVQDLKEQTGTDNLELAIAHLMINAHD